MVAKRKKFSLKLKLLGAVFLVMCLAILFIFAIGPALERNVVESVQCKVAAAESRTSSGTFKGSSTFPSILVQTADCGDLVIHNGVNCSNQKVIALSFEPACYEF